MVARVHRDAALRYRQGWMKKTKKPGFSGGALDRTALAKSWCVGRHRKRLPPSNCRVCAESAACCGAHNTPLDADLNKLPESVAASRDLTVRNDRGKYFVNEDFRDRGSFRAGVVGC